LKIFFLTVFIRNNILSHMKSSSKSFNSNQSCKNCLRNPQQNSLFVPWKLRAGKQVSPPSTGRVAWLGVIKCIHMNAIKFIVSWSPWWLFRAGNEVQRLRGQMLKGTRRVTSGPIQTFKFASSVKRYADPKRMSPKLMTQAEGTEFHSLSYKSCSRCGP